MHKFNSKGNNTFLLLFYLKNLNNYIMTQKYFNLL